MKLIIRKHYPPWKNLHNTLLIATCSGIKTLLVQSSPLKMTKNTKGNNLQKSGKKSYCCCLSKYFCSSFLCSSFCVCMYFVYVCVRHPQIISIELRAPPAHSKSWQRYWSTDHSTAASLLNSRYCYRPCASNGKHSRKNTAAQTKAIG